jgi:acetylornithine deacetylase
MKALRYAKRLVSFDTTSHLSNRLICKYLEMKLTKHGFFVEKTEYVDQAGVRKQNVIAKIGRGKGGLAYFAHSDVVPASNWFDGTPGPFEPTVMQDRLYGRGSCDMKGSIACMLAAAQRFGQDDLKRPLYFVVTADEETGFAGARSVVNDSKIYREIVDNGTRAIIGEPTSLDIVYAHKGIYEITATSAGRAGHSSTREGGNANVAMIPFLQDLNQLRSVTESDPAWQNNLFDPPTLTMNICIKDNAEAPNVTPSKSVCVTSLRPMPGVVVEPLIEKLVDSAQRNSLQLEVQRHGAPMLTDAGSEFVAGSLELADKRKARSACYGTDGGVFTEIENKIVLGPGSIDQAHTHDEWISLEQLEKGTELFGRMIRHWCG